MNDYIEDHTKVSEAIMAVEDMTDMLEIFIENTSVNVKYKSTINKINGKWRTELKIDK
jgi:hypothetical protein